MIGTDVVCVPRILDSKEFTEGTHELAYISEEDKECLRAQNGYGGQYIYDPSNNELFVTTNVKDYNGKPQ